MTHIDPFAPADSDQHPANWTPDIHESGPEIMNPGPVADDAAPPWIALVGDPIPATPEGEQIADARWEEYETLLREHGTPEQIEIFDAILTAEWPEDMPTLVALRDKAAPPEGESTGEHAEEELDAALAKLDEAGL